MNRNLTPGAVLLLATTVVASGLACGSSSSGAAHACTPGQSIACVGPGSCMGGQACKADGSGYEECSCGGGQGADGGSMPDGGGSSGGSGGSSGGTSTSGGGTTTPGSDAAPAPDAATDSGGSTGDAPSGPPHDAGGAGPNTGTPCGQNDNLCTGGAICNQKLGTCQLALGNGGQCLRDFECKTNVCSYVTDTCISPAADLTACQRDVECAGGLCNEAYAQCAPPQPYGVSCVRDQECASYSCVSGTCN